MTLNGLTLDEVRTTKAALEAQGEYASADKVLRTIGRGSKKTVLKHLRTLAGASGPRAPVATPDPVPVPMSEAPVSTADPVAVLERRAPPPDPVAQAEAAVDDAREVMQMAAWRLSLVDGILHNSQRHGYLLSDDPARAAFREDAKAADIAYRRAWGALQEARQTAAQRQAVAAQTAREAWVREHRPEVVSELQRAEQTYAKVQKLPDDPQKPKAHYAARHLLQTARAAYSQALALAPVNTNGHTS
jgi:molybdenum-dependent DNA-binding transcriptional regulator ModE